MLFCYFLFCVAIILLPKTFSIITSPILIGRVAVALLMATIHSAIFSFGIGRSVFTERGVPSVQITVEVTVLNGLVHSFSA